MTLKIAEFASIAQHNGDSVAILQGGPIAVAGAITAAGTYTTQTNDPYSYVKCLADGADHTLSFGTDAKFDTIKTGTYIIYQLPKGTVVKCLS